MFNLKKISPAMYLMEKEGPMKVPGLLIANEKLLKDIEIQKPLEQMKNVATLKGIVGHSIAMPDIHWGYGFPIGGVAAMDFQEGVISPGGVGYDINCGVRLALVPLEFKSLSEKIKTTLLDVIYNKVPSGIGSGHRKTRGLSERDYVQLASLGAEFSLKEGYGFEEDLKHTESHGCIEGANIENVSSHAKERGKKQLGSVGSGNHFIEIGAVEKIFLPKIAAKWGVKVGLTYILIHTGSRGFGHQICQDTINAFLKKGYAESLPDKQLVAAPIQSQDGRNYFSAMATAANFAFNNRQRILHLVREAFFEVCRIQPHEIKQLYDVCHNMAKIEKYEVDGSLKKLCVHRKGATRAFGPGAEELAPIFQETGQPVLVPGDMGRASYLLAGSGNQKTWMSCCHGAGRAKSRIQSAKSWKGQDLLASMQKMGVRVRASSRGTIVEEMPDAYKDVDDVVAAAVEANLAKNIAKFKPALVIKG